jgi:hypothetical protein
LSSALPAGPDQAPLVVLADRADAIVVGTIAGSEACGDTQRRPGDTFPDRRITVLRVLKGRLEPGTVITSFAPPRYEKWDESGVSPGSGKPTDGVPTGMRERWWTSADGERTHGDPNCTGLWFLVESAAGRWSTLGIGRLTVEDDLLPLPADEPLGAWRYGAEDALIDKLAKELRAGLDSSAAEVVSEAAGAIQSFRWLLRDPVSTVPPSEPNALARFEGSQVLRKHLREHPAAQCVLAQTFKDWDGLVAERLAAFAENNPGQSFLPPKLLGALTNVSDPGALPALTRLLADAEHTRPGAPAAATSRSEAAIAEAVRNIHTEESLPLLAKLLDSSNKDSQYIAVQGFGMAALHCRPGPGFKQCSPPSLANVIPTEMVDAAYQHMPTISAFEADPQKYIQFWKSWYARHVAPGKPR